MADTGLEKALDEFVQATLFPEDSQFRKSLVRVLDAWAESHQIIMYDSNYHCYPKCRSASLTVANYFNVSEHFEDGQMVCCRCGKLQEKSKDV